MLHPSPLPFRKAILESGSPTSRSVLSASHPRTAAQHKLLVSQLRPPTALALASARLDDLFNAALMVWATHSNALTWPFQPVVDDRDPGPGQVNVLPDLPVRMWGEYRRRLLETASSPSPSSDNTAAPAVITGFCSHEGVDFVPKRGLATAADFRRFFAHLIPAFSPDDLDALEALYADPVGNPLSPYRHTGREGSQWRRLHEAYGHYAYICPVIHTAHELASASPSSPVYLYEYAAVSSPSSPSAPHASHAAAAARDPRAIPASRPGLRAVSREMHARWSAFCASPDGLLPEAQWPPFESPFAEGADPARAGKMLVFGAGNDEASGGRAPGVPVSVRTLTDREMDVCRFWWDRMELSQGMGERGVTTKTW
jgi:hypothetical protein